MPADRKTSASICYAIATVLAAWLVGAATAATAQSGDSSALPPLDSLTQTVERPLFMTDRRPPPPVEDNVEDSKPAQSGLFTLVGIIVSPTQRIALVKVRGSQEVLQLNEGQQANGWTVSEIRPQGVILESNDKTETIELIDVSPPQPRQRRSRDRRAAPPAPPAPAAPPNRR